MGKKGDRSRIKIKNTTTQNNAKKSGSDSMPTSNSLDNSSSSQINTDPSYKTLKNHANYYAAEAKKYEDKAQKQRDLLNYLYNADRKGPAIFSQIDNYLKQTLGSKGKEYTGEVVTLPRGYGSMSGRKVYHFDPDGFGEYYIYPDGTIFEDRISGNKSIDHNPWTFPGSDNYIALRDLVQFIFKDKAKDYRGNPIKWTKFSYEKKQGGTLDYKHYFDFFNNKFN